MARAILMDLTLTGAFVLSLALLVVADTDVTIPIECPKSDIENTTVSLAHENDCTKYYGCSNGKKYLMECPIMDGKGNRLHFNPVLQACDWPDKVHCKLPKSRVAIKPRAVIAKECPRFDSIQFTVHLPHEEDCTKFYTCSHGTKYLMDCPFADENGNRLHFNAVLQVCDWPRNAGCKFPNPDTKPDTTPATTTPTTTPLPEELEYCVGSCPKIENPEFIATLPYKGDCTKYCLCDKGIAEIRDCPFGLHFDMAMGVCDSPSNANCYEEEKQLHRQ